MAEQQIEQKLRQNLDSGAKITVRDTSGGCGSMYSIEIEAADFKDKRLIQQHKLVNEILKDEIKGWHGLTLKTSIPKE